ncbi:MAG TPA: glycosyltransferase [Candidatus Marinimicrobia bacterium]|nr:glycosyltransferase [Candidatus Neomarinimicrobiota bacterium]HIN45795.1 glycosyltransferase [Candidatus Neomarinimicrobiota bacterium]
MLGTIFLVIIGLYCATLLFFFAGLFKKGGRQSVLKPFVSIVIPAKNEAKNIVNILNNLSQQTYPEDLFEVIVVDDKSQDYTATIVNDFMGNISNLQLLSTAGVESSLRYKKHPLNLGIRKSQGEILLLTDADCTVSSNWIAAMVSSFTENVGMVIGYSEASPVRTITQKLEALDFLMLLSAARGSAALGDPYACTGQNLAYRRQAFDAVEGFSAFASQVGGDDTLLMQQIKRQTSWEIVFSPDPDSFVKSTPQETAWGFITQRIRWATDTLQVWKTDPLFFGIIVVTFLANLLSLTFPFMLFNNPLLIPIVCYGLCAKFAVEGAVMLKGTSFFNRQELRSVYLLWFLLQIPYITFMGLLSFFGNFLPWGGKQNR